MALALRNQLKRRYYRLIILGVALLHSNSISSSDDEDPKDFISLYLPLALLTTTTLVVTDLLCFLRTYMEQMYSFFCLRHPKPPMI